MMANTSASRPWETSEVSVDHKHHEKKKNEKKTVPCGGKLHIPLTSYHLLAAQHELYRQNRLSLNETF